MKMMSEHHSTVNAIYNVFNVIFKNTFYCCINSWVPFFLSTGLHAAFTVTVPNPSVKVKENEGKFHLAFYVCLSF